MAEKPKQKDPAIQNRKPDPEPGEQPDQSQKTRATRIEPEQKYPANQNWRSSRPEQRSREAEQL